MAILISGFKYLKTRETNIKIFKACQINQEAVTPDQNKAII